MATTTILNAGEEIDSRCLKCKDVTNHTIIAMVEEKIAKVQCNVCGGKHNYRPAKPIKTKKKSNSAKKATAKTKTSRSLKTAADNYTKMMNGRNLDEAMPYAMTAIFSKDDLVNHPTFGLGLVTAAIPPNKIELTFNEGPKIFICELKSPNALVPGSGLKTKKRKRV
ncbi:MAG: hypothetical protein KAR13_13960 [Desulfobulbaceae bacterium]|nr:hypothetical protein [Desulfobulbaceae bacterium]MCK5323196.1 hypothetical protein [Desulfobulbaceae bacterium]MCK5544588.1 hypothetical protein [Desulfobulbaceae bacterium]